MAIKNKKVIYLKDYVKGTDGSLADKIVVGSDIRPGQAVNLAVNNTPIQVVTNGFDEFRVVRIKGDVNKFLDNPGECLIEITEDISMRFQQKFFGHSSKKDFLSQVEQFLKSSKYRRVRDDIFLIADELFTNFTKTATNNTKSMRFGIDANDETVVVYCRDFFGTLEPKKMLENMQRCFDKGVKNAIKKDTNCGAGIGSFLIYTLGVGMAITVDPGKGTLVLVWLPRTAHHEDRVEMNKSLIIIEAKES
jgi:hypothetical protein